MRHTRDTWLVLLALLLVALNLRLPVAAVSPVLPQMRVDLGLSRGAAGLLTTLPVICFGVLAPVATLLGRRLGARLAVFVAMIALTVGIVVRSAGGAALVIGGTVLLGAGIAVSNILIPALIKGEVPRMAGTAMALYTATLTGGATLAAAATAPMVHTWGMSWRAALAVGAIPAALATVFWLVRMWPVARRTPLEVRSGGPGLASPGPAAAPPSRSVAAVIWRSPVAWALAWFMMTQSLLFYSLLAWLPAQLQERGVSANESGLMLSLFAGLGIIGALVVPGIATRLPDQSVMAVVTALVWLVGMVGLWQLPSLLLLWIVVLGVGQGAGIAMAMILIVLRSAHGAAARELSGMVQLTGYVVASFGPFVLGVLRDWSGAWDWSMGVLVTMSALLVVAAYGAGRPHELG